jgi:nucleotide-binding universal stress UspA family protein
MMPGIVVGIDQSAHAHQALEWAMREAALRNADLTVMSVISAQASPFTRHQLTVPDAGELTARAQQAAEEAVAEASDRLGDSKPASVAVKVFTGYPAQALIDASKEADLVVVGSRGTGGFAELVLGSVSSQVAHHAVCPVVIVPSAR